jgi:acyl-CoA reductase-like NAD-dependent aldehyde dehydrogenase
VDPETWMTQLIGALSPPAGTAATVLDPVTDAERDALLDIARVAAHTSERWTAPVSTFLAGVAYASLPADERARTLRTLADHLDAEHTAADDDPGGS